MVCQVINVHTEMDGGGGGGGGGEKIYGRKEMWYEGRRESR